MPPKQFKIKPYGNPNPANITQTSDPQKPQDKVQAIADNIEAAVKGRIEKNMLSRELLMEALTDALGKDKEDLKQYKANMENDFGQTSKTAKSKPKVSKDEQPELKKVSTSKNINIEVPGGKNSGNSKNRNRTKK